jgi:hypothetical protein
MRLVLFDLGDTLETHDVPRPGVLETLAEIASLRAGGAPAALLGLLSDFDMPSDPAELPGIQRKYYAILDALGIRGFFEPVDRRVTLSSEVGARKPAVAMFRAAIAKAEPALTFGDTMFVTESRAHVDAARALGLRAVHLSPPGTTHGEISRLPELLPIVRDFVAADLDVVRTTLGDHVIELARTNGRSVRGTTRAAGRDVLEDRLHLVTQNGALFRQEHPDVPVLVDKGRYLVVDVDPKEIERLDDTHGTCWSIRPLPAGADIVARVRATPGARQPPIRACVDALSPAVFRADLETLVAHTTRYSTSPGFAAALRWADDQLSAAGYHTQTQPVPVDGATSHNLIADRPGTGPEPRDVVLVTAHLDSINLRGGPSALAPGADDNASGSAGLLSIARALAGTTTRLDLRFILFGGEEEGLYGSKEYVRRLPVAERDRIHAVINMDMIGHSNTAAPEVLLEGAAVSATVLDDLATAAATYTTLAVTRSYSPYNSDHVPFIEAGIPAVLTIEGADSANTAIHSEADTIDTVDTDLALEILRMNTAFTAGVLDIS